MVKILELFSKQEKAELFKNTIKKTYEKNEIIFEKDEQPCYMYILLAGIIHICNDSYDGNTTILTVIDEQGDCFGEVYLFLANDYPFYAKAIKDSTVLLIPKELFNSSLVLSNHLNTILANKAFVLSQKLVLMMEDSLRDKIINYVTNNPDVKMKRYEMANYLGVSRPALSKEIYKMIDEDILEIDASGRLKLVI